MSSPLFYVTFGVAGGVYLVQKFGSNASLVFSAAPIVALTYISKSEFGRTLEEAAKKAKEMDERGEDGGREGREKRRGLAKGSFRSISERREDGGCRGRLRRQNHLFFLRI